MTIDDSNKEEIFDGLMQRKYALEDLKSIKAQLEENPALLREYELHKKMVQAARQIETGDFRQRLSDYKEEGVVHNVFVRTWREYPYAVAASVALLLIAGYFILNSTPGQQIAQQGEIQYQEINSSSFGAAGTSDTLNLSMVILQYPDDKVQGYAFRSDTLVLYGRFDLGQLRYRLNTQTQERTLFIGQETKTLDYVVEKEEL